MKSVKRILWFVLLVAVLCAVLVGCGKKGKGPSEECKHENQTTVVTDPSCTEKGKSTVKCSDCGAVISEIDIEAVGHKFVRDEASDVAATCNAEGKIAFKCSVCGESEKELTDKISHSFIKDAENSVEATCTADGVSVTKCEFCGKTNSTAVLALGHNIVSSWEYTGVEELKQGETCVYICERVASCERCGTIKETDEKIKHDYQFDVITLATCTVAGQKGYACVDCNAQQNPEANVSYTVDHNWNAGADSGEYKLYECSDCTATRKEFTGSSATVNSGDLSSEIKLNDTVISMDQSVRDQIGDSEATLSADGLGKDDIPAGTPGLDSVGADDTVYNITLTANGTPITKFGDGVVTVKLPYTLGEGEDPACITIFYLDPVDGVVKFDGAVYHDGYVTFETSHFSYYMVGRYSVKEICAKFGHNWFVCEREATCTDSGFNLTYCARCLETTDGYAPYIAPLGHQYGEPDETKAAGCTEDGYNKYTCAECGNVKTEVLDAIGHDWRETGKVEVTCGSNGYVERTCENCQEVRVQYFDKLPHNYKTETVLPTCSEAGYKKYTCRNCGHTYNESEAPALGHKWDIEAPTCAKGQTCTVCGVAGQTATEDHTMSEGICTVCGKGCEHNYQLKEEVTASCTEGGYKIYKCDSCLMEETRDQTPAAGHKYDESTGICSVCNKSESAFIKALLESMYTDKYTLKLTDFSIVSKTKDVSSGEVKNNGNYRIDLAELVISVEGELVKLYGNGKVIYYSAEGDTESQELVLYGDGYDIYAKASSSSQLKPNIRKYSYDYFIKNITGAEAGATGSNVDILTAILGEELAEKWTALMDSSSEELYAVLYTIFNDMFADNGDNTYSFNPQVLKALNDNLYTYTIAELVDVYYGEGTYAKLKSTILDAENKTMEELATAIFEYAEKNGIAEDMAFATVDAILGYMTGEEVDFRAMLDDPDFGSVTLSQMLEAMTTNENEEYTFVYADFINARLSVVEEYKFYSLITVSEENARYFHDMIGSIADSLNIVITTDEAGAVQNIALTIEGFEAVVYKYAVSAPNQGGESAQEPNEFEGIIEADGRADIEFGEAEIPTTAEAFKNEYNELYNKVIAAIKSKCEASADGTWYMPNSWDDAVMLFSIDSNGNLGFTIYGCNYSYDQDGNWASSINLSDKRSEFISISELILFIDSDCGNVYSVKSDSYEYEYENTEYGRYETQYISLSLYIDVETKDIFIESQHNYEEYIPSDLPEGTPLSPDDVSCEEEWYSYQKCSYCQDEISYTNYKWHGNYREECVLVEGATSCEEGVIITNICGYCGEVASSYTTDYHASFVIEETVYETIHGKLVVKKWTCACGSNIGVDYYDGDCSCSFSYEYNEPIFDEHGVEIGYCEYYKCTEDGCTVTMTITGYNSAPTEKPCEYSRPYYYTFYDNGTLIVEYTYTRIYTEHNDMQTSCELLPGSVSCEDGIVVNNYCANCGYSETYEDNYHRTYDKIYSIDTPHGEMKIARNECACGYYIRNLELRYDDSTGCSLGDFEWDESLGIYIARCTITHIGLDGEESECPFYATSRVIETLIPGETCEYDCYDEYKFYNGGAQIGETLYSNIRTDERHDRKYYADSEYDGNGILIKYVEGATCTLCDYKYEYVKKYDEVGRTVYYSYMRYYKGTYHSNYYDKYVYDSLTSCNCKHYYCDYLKDSNEVLVEEFEKHFINYNDNFEQTCTQPGFRIEYCAFCDYTYCYDTGWYYGSIYHEFWYDDSIEKYVCIKCGLESVSGSNGGIIMEDLTNNGLYGSEGNYTIGFEAIFDSNSNVAAPVFYFVSKSDSEDKIYADISSWSFEKASYVGYTRHENSLIVISKADLALVAEATGVDLENYDLAITLSFEGADPNDETLFYTLVLTEL